MGYIFYFFAIFPILWEGANISNPVKTFMFVKNLKSKKSTEHSAKESALTGCMLGYLLWVFVGIFTSQWILFLVLLIISLPPKKYVWLSWLDSLISFGLLLFIVLNKYHLHIDIQGLLWELF